MLEVQLDHKFPAKTPNSKKTISNVETRFSQDTRYQKLSTKQGLMINFVKDLKLSEI